MDDKGKSRLRAVLAQQRISRGVKNFVTKMHFDNYLSSGMSPTEAAKRVGVNIPPGRELNTPDIVRLIEKGKFRKRM